jgi:hypothetical protein
MEQALEATAFVSLFIGFLFWVNVFWKRIWKESIMQFYFKSGAVFFFLDLFLLQ